MELVEERYQRFKGFLRPHINDTAHSMALNAASLSVFLQTLAKYSKDSPVTITSKICNSFNIVLDEYSKEDIETFHRYLAYFSDVARNLY